MLKKIGKIVGYGLVFCLIALGSLAVYALTGGFVTASEGLSNGRPFKEAGTVSTERTEFGWNFYSMRVVCQEGAVAVGLVGNRAIALNGHTTSLARRGLKFKTASRTTIDIIAPDRPDLIAAGIIRPSAEPINYNVPLSAGLQKALSTCGL